MTPPRALLVAWDYPHAEHSTGAALARRVRQVARGFAARGWIVDVISRDHFAARSSAGSVRMLADDADGAKVRIHCVGGPDGKPAESIGVLRVVSSAWHALTMGDRTGRWARVAMSYMGHGSIRRPDIVIGFFTPRGPLLAAAWASRYWTTPWIADLQDEWSQGSGGWLRPFVRRWMRRTLAGAGKVIQVSPEWAAMDRRALGREVVVLRHALPTAAMTMVRDGRIPGDEVTLLYSGSLNVDEQNPRPLLEALRDIRAVSRNRTRFRLTIACTEASFATWRREADRVGVTDAIQWLGWLDAQQLENASHNASALVLIPLSTPERPGVPSKLFAYLATGRPVLIAGPDSGGLTSVFEEWGAPNVLCADASAVRRALEGLEVGDLRLLLRRSTLGRAPVDERELGETYVQWALELVHGRSRSLFTTAGVGDPNLMERA
jgi:glycosyltransferase involved in cell wall biosynthesis